MSSKPVVPDRPSPEALLRQAKREGRGRLKVFLGAAPGVGKTYEMLSDGAALRRSGVDVVIGVVETHGRAETAALVEGYDIIPRATLEHQGRSLEEMDLDAIIARKPALVLVDELAHTNVAGSRHPKRHQDVEELLAAGIDVFTTVNIQHIESLNDVVASFTKVRVRETVPDSVIEDAEIEIVDIPPDELIERLKQGKVYVPHEATRALGHFFSKSNLSALRELALRRAAQRVDAQMLDDIRAQGLTGTWAGGERILVAVSELPGADGLVRAAKRLADALRAPWVALHVETPRTAHFAEEERKSLAATLQLASRLGAEVVSVPSENVIDGIKRYAADARTTQIVIGKSARSRWFELRHGSVVDRLVRETPEIAVHVLPNDAGEAGPRPRRARGGPAYWGSPAGYLWSILLIAAVTLVGVSIQLLGQVTNIGLLYMLPVMFAATRYGMRTGVITGMISALAYNFFFIPPIHTFTIQDPQNVMTLVVLVLVAIASSQLASRVQAQAELARRSARQNNALAGFARNLTGITDRAELGRVLTAEVARLLDVESIFVLPGSDGPVVEASSAAEFQFDMLDQAAARWSLDKGQSAGRGSGTLTASDWMFQPLGAGGRVRALLGLASPGGGEIIRPDQHPLMISLVDQASLALERVELEGEMAGIAQLEERDRLRAALLSSVSHDLRTPLTTIIASLSELKRRHGDEPEIAAIEGEAQRLNRFVANLLDMVRIEAGALNLSLDPVDLTDAVANAAHDLRAALAAHPLKLDVSPDLPFVRVDAQLLHHILINLIDNAAKYSPDGAPITVRASRYSGGIKLQVIDGGSGLPVGEEERMFDTFTRLAGSDRTGGTGLGLAIVRGFAEAMGLGVAAANRDDEDGAVFTLDFPETRVIRESAPQ